MKLKKTVRRMLCMCPAAWDVFILSVKLTAFLLFCAFLLLLSWNGGMQGSYTAYMTAMALYEIGQSVLLVGVLFSVCIEDLSVHR